MTKAEQWNPTLEKILDTCSVPVLQEMAWAIGSSPLLDQPSADRSILWNGDHHGEALRTFSNHMAEWSAISSLESKILGDGHMRLGRRFECLVNWWFEAAPQWEVLAKNLVIQGAERTLGELDLVVKNREDEQTLHLELACKFYLQTNGSRSWQHWIGMDPKDRLDLKFEKLEHQLLLEEEPETKALLQEKHVQIDRSASWIKGWFFVHFRDALRAKLPLHAHDSASAGWWCKKSEWDSIWNTHSPWIIIPSEHWLRIRHDGSAAVLISDTDQLHEWVETKRHAMVAQVKWHNNQWLETSRGIIVKDNWPFLQMHSI
jgi:hypothetical protein